MQPGRLQHVDVDEGVIVHDLCLVRLDESDPTHVRGEIVHLLYPSSRLQTVVPTAKVEEREFIRRRLPVLRNLEIYAAHPISATLQILDEMVTDESAGSADQYSLHLAQPSPRALSWRSLALLKPLSCNKASPTKSGLFRA